ncbi:MAG: M24 family metallopeptidase [Defluviitaleaceae bacterium]|nr:M24 family metallopeptidase [Defluviitaleaceae bacterium]
MLTKLRKLMQENNIDAYIITKFDPHQTEYADNYYNVTSFISGFTGSVATVVITKTEAHLWTDSRYFLQAEKELPEEFTLQKMGEQGTIDVLDFVVGFGTVGIDFATYPAESGKKLARKIKVKQGTLVDIDLISLIWNEREFAKREGIFLYDEKFTGESFENKLSLVRSQMKTPCYIISSLDDIAWFLNIRSLGEFNTFNFLAYIFIEPKNVILFIDKVDKDIFPEGIEIKPYSEVFDYIKGKETSIAPTRTNYKIYQTLEKKMVLIHDITTTLKSKKNTIEIENIKKANIKDAVVHIKFYKWLKENGAGKTEYEIGKKLYEMRIEAGAKNHSFPPIIGYLENGAIVHYRASENSSKIVQNKGFLLVDSGANYIEGTTDITRTISMGSLSEKEKDHYTLVLKAHIALDTQKFPQGTSGMALDAVTRMPLWNALLNFGHGTGHGIGHFLNVHEGPCTIAPKGFEPLYVGNVLSNEPGLYITGEYGIRL